MRSIDPRKRAAAKKKKMPVLQKNLEPLELEPETLMQKPETLPRGHRGWIAKPVARETGRPGLSAPWQRRVAEMKFFGWCTSGTNTLPLHLHQFAPLIIILFVSTARHRPPPRFSSSQHLRRPFPVQSSRGSFLLYLFLPPTCYETYHNRHHFSTPRASAVHIHPFMLSCSGASSEPKAKVPTGSHGSTLCNESYLYEYRERRLQFISSNIWRSLPQDIISAVSFALKIKKHFLAPLNESSWLAVTPQIFTKSLHSCVQISLYQVKVYCVVVGIHCLSYICV